MSRQGSCPGQACQRTPARCFWSTETRQGYAGHVRMYVSDLATMTSKTVRDVQRQSSEPTQADVLDFDDRIAWV